MSEPKDQIYYSKEESGLSFINPIFDPETFVHFQGQFEDRRKAHKL